MRKARLGNFVATATLLILALTGAQRAEAQAQPAITLAQQSPLFSTASGARCAHEPSLRSTQGAISTFIIFVNQMATSLRLYWIDYKGMRQPYGVLEPYQRRQQQTYVTHPWVLTDGNDKCVAVYMPAAQTKVEYVAGDRAAAPDTAPAKADTDVTSQTQSAAKERLVGVWLGLHEKARFLLGCESGEPVRSYADDTYVGPGARGTWQLRDGRLTETATEVDKELGGDPAQVAKPYVSDVVWQGADTFVKTFSDGARMTFRRCPDTVTAAAAAANMPEEDMEAQRCIWRCLADSKGLPANIVFMRKRRICRTSAPTTRTL